MTIPVAALDALTEGVGLIVLPGGSPGGLLDVLAIGDGGRTVGDHLVGLWSAGTAISGASAGAMVLCERSAVSGGATMAAGLGLVPGAAIPHWTPGSQRRWTVPDTVPLWGLPECGGVLIDHTGMIGVGQGAASVCLAGTWSVVDRSTPQELPS